MSTKIRICIRTAIWIILQCITFMAYAQNIGGACITSLTYTTSDASSYIVQKVYANGNMTKDRNKGISNITYNTMNLPSRIEFENGSRATYLYSSDGTKLQVKYETSYAGLLASGPPSGSASTAIADIHTIDYVGNKIYEDGVLSRILVEGGYVDYSGETPIYHTYLTDHQGNVRVVVDENAAVKQVNHYYPYGALFAESTNGDVQPYKYNGKELDRMHGRDWYDHGARHNDAAIGRWHVMDPLCEKYYDVSPYAYCAGDPVNRVDINGDSISIAESLIPAIYNALKDIDGIKLTFNNGVLNPKSIETIAKNSDDVFLSDLLEISKNPSMVIMYPSINNTYNKNGERITEEFMQPYDDEDTYPIEYCPDGLYGKHIQGNLGQSLFPSNVVASGKSSIDNNIRIIINGKGSLNQKTVGVAHEFAHVVLYLRNLPFGHRQPNVDNFVYGRSTFISKKLGYDY